LDELAVTIAGAGPIPPATFCFITFVHFWFLQVPLGNMSGVVSLAGEKLSALARNLRQAHLVSLGGGRKPPQRSLSAVFR